MEKFTATAAAATHLLEATVTTPQNIHNDEVDTTTRSELLRLIVRQLQAYDLAQAAQALSKIAGLTDYTLDPSSQLEEYYQKGINLEKGLVDLVHQQPSKNYFENNTFLKSSSGDQLEHSHSFSDDDNEFVVDVGADINPDESHNNNNNNNNEDGSSNVESEDASSSSLLDCKNLCRSSSLLINEESNLQKTKKKNSLLSRETGLTIFKSDVTTSRPAPTYVAGFSGMHKASVSSASFSYDGRFVATASHDCTLRVMDVDLLDDLAHGRTSPTFSRQEPEDGPIIKSLYDHSGMLHDVTFHPINLVLASCSADHNIRFYDITRSSSRRSFRYLADTHPVYSISFHPAGTYLVAATAHPMVRMYDVRTFRCFSMTEDAHIGGVSCVRVSPDGKMVATTGFDGNIRLWDCLNAHPIATWRAAHGGELVTSMTWSRNSRYILSSGRENAVRMWEATSGRSLKAYYNAAHERARLTSCLTSTEEHVVATDEITGEIVLWDTLSGEQVSRLDSTHRGSAPRVVSSQESQSLLTYGDDGRFRYWSGTESISMINSNVC